MRNMNTFPNLVKIIIEKNERGISRRGNCLEGKKSVAELSKGKMA